MIQESFKTDNLLVKGFVTVFLSSVFFGLLGGIAGLIIGLVVPGYYEVMFPRIVHSNSMETWMFGVALGFTQGLVAGVVIGCVVLLSTAWYKSRMQNSLAAMIAQYQVLGQNQGHSAHRTSVVPEDSNSTSDQSEE